MVGGCCAGFGTCCGLVPRRLEGTGDESLAIDACRVAGEPATGAGEAERPARLMSRGVDIVVGFASATAERILLNATSVERECVGESRYLLQQMTGVRTWGVDHMSVSSASDLQFLYLAIDQSGEAFHCPAPRP